jgi:hypothetical protein
MTAGQVVGPNVAETLGMSAAITTNYSRRGDRSERPQQKGYCVTALLSGGPHTLPEICCSRVMTGLESNQPESVRGPRLSAPPLPQSALPLAGGS